MEKRTVVTQEDLVHLQQSTRSGLEPTRKVLVRMFGQQIFFYHGTIVVEVPAELTDEEVQERLRKNTGNLPWPSDWKRLDDREIDLSQDTPEAKFVALVHKQTPLSEVVAVAYSGEADAGRKANARLVVDEDGDQEIVA